ncbi:Predicted pyrophosphatase or phosphodiesterase, AlkP superfamily [Propionibacterium cyclohexanicum]|uniref:Predicted pyrophosphatase or phosphodiesterase, AlkP superfamily n=1 Tax=Propionibacterium cyclohexanicum TaxID=64702 RepID=A0A1H9QPC8_9ACTN|nr:nucleotide pyrophosphatase/phosphodiesterase family protein [Propionibacterium cyclohexanicum]SER62312.1 Predicted pyrophosphatase or phosphodiesterase, AlkP superfamily [Propionibacterium cyclohexanicum]
MSGPLPAAPDYGHNTLAEVLGAVACRLGAGGHDPWGLPKARGYVVLLVDGLGWHQLRRHLSILEYFPELLGEARPISAAVPSTTAVSLTTLGTGLPPGQHGIVGYTFRTAPGGRVLNALHWGSGDPQPELFQPHPTWFQRLEQAGVAVSTVARAKFSDSGLTRAGLRGGSYHPVDDVGTQQRIEEICRTVATPGPALAYVYEGDLDHSGHAFGVDSSRWRACLARIDHDLELLRRALPGDVCLLVTGDHGMIDVPAGAQILFEDEPQLRSGVDLLSGEGRFRQLYTGSADAVAARWSRCLGDRAWVCTRRDAAEAGWFGPVLGASAAGRLGDVLVAMRGNWAVMTTARPHELELIGQHGSLSDEEMRVPLVVDEGWGGQS